MAKELSPDKVKAQNNSILIAALKSLGIEATASGRNDLVIGEKKVLLCSYYE
jgi:lipoate-protein ligase A